MPNNEILEITLSIWNTKKNALRDFECNSYDRAQTLAQFPELSNLRILVDPKLYDKVVQVLYFGLTKQNYKLYEVAQFFVYRMLYCA